MKLRVIGISTAAVYALAVIVLLGLAMLGSDGLGPLAQGSPAGVWGLGGRQVTTGAVKSGQDRGRSGATDGGGKSGAGSAGEGGSSNSGTGPGSSANGSTAASGGRIPTSTSASGRSRTP